MRIKLPANVWLGGTYYGGRTIDATRAIDYAAIADDFQSALYVLDAVLRVRERLAVKLERAVVRELDAEERGSRQYAALRAARMVLQDQFLLVERTAYGIEDVLEEEERRIQRLEARRERRRKPKLPPPDAAGGDDFDGDSYGEWEFGFSYEVVTGFAASASAVDVNFRVRRIDGRPFPAREAANVMAYAQANLGRVPDGYRIATVNWRSPNKRDARWKSGSAGDVIDSPLANVMAAIKDSPTAWRLGAPKE